MDDDAKKESQGTVEAGATVEGATRVTKHVKLKINFGCANQILE